uniref:Uncharacterized protein n=1 Tax=Physcomitrium patens TaxID=3218 RepID=A0A2K1ICT5_PHYPA|nr:hypothetical protein PHYPA_030573 [Physcomitrium patens]
MPHILRGVAPHSLRPTKFRVGGFCTQSHRGDPLMSHLLRAYIDFSSSTFEVLVPSLQFVTQGVMRYATNGFT